MRVLALDPGERVGWARADVAEDGTWSDLRHGITPLRDMAIAIHDGLGIDTHCRCGRSYEHETTERCAPVNAPKYDVIVCEDWRLYPDKVHEFSGSAFPSVQFIGMVRLCCWLSGARFVLQGARIKKAADKSMAALRPELYEKVTRPLKHDDAHDLDALRHLWFHTFKHTAVVPPAAEGVAA